MRRPLYARILLALMFIVGSIGCDFDPNNRLVGDDELIARVGVGRNVWSDSTRILLQQYVNKLGPMDQRWMRGYYYARQPLEREGSILASDLVAASRSTRYASHDVILFRHIEGPWYVYSHRGYTD